MFQGDCAKSTVSTLLFLLGLVRVPPDAEIALNATAGAIFERGDDRVLTALFLEETGARRKLATTCEATRRYNHFHNFVQRIANIYKPLVVF